MRRFLPLLALFLTLGSLAPAAESSVKPNIIIILADDLGWGDLACYGNPSIRTPNLDRMAAEGMRFTDFYASADVCTPSRAGLITGRFAVRSGMANDQFRVLRKQSIGGLPAEEITIAQGLKPAGYATGCIGKWHLGNYMNVPAHHPLEHGFDFYYGLPHSNDMNGTSLAPKGAAGRLDQDPEWWAAPLFRNKELIEQPADQTTLTKRYTAEAVKFIGEHKSGPFFLYFAHTFPHVPLFASKGFSGKSERGLYGDVVEEIDWSVGQVMATLRKEGIEKNTLVFFTSDNGPWLIMGMAGGSAGMLRDGKGSTFEGGMREPGIAWWPGKIQPGVVTHEMGCNVDLFTTALALGGVAKPADRPIDGVDLSPVLFGTGPGNRKAMFYYRGTQLYAVRKGLYKAHYLTCPAYGPGSGKPEKHDPPLLYQLGQDPGEQHDVAAAHPEVLAEIAQEMEKQQATLTPVKNQLVEVMPQGAPPQAPKR